jgi:hypothetical protein
VAVTGKSAAFKDRMDPFLTEMEKHVSAPIFGFFLSILLLFNDICLFCLFPNFLSSADFIFG